MIFQVVISALIALLFVHESFGDDSDHSGTNGFSTGQTIGVALLGTTLIGSGAHFLMRFVNKRDRMRDSVVTAYVAHVHNADSLYSLDEYSAAAVLFDSASLLLSEYSAITKNKKVRINPEAVQRSSKNAHFLKTVDPSLDRYRTIAAELPKDEFAVVTFNRHRFQIIKKQYTDLVKQVKYANPSYTEAIDHGFRSINAAIAGVDSLLAYVYDQEKLSFSLKSKFYFNRAIDGRSQNELGEFVKDCDYYQIDKDWCNRARAMVNEKSVPLAFSDVKQLTPFQTDFTVAKNSSELAVLESFLKRYKNRKEKSIDTIRIRYDSIQTVIQKIASFDRMHPLVANTEQLPINVKVNGSTDQIAQVVHSSINLYISEFYKVNSMRYPLVISADFNMSPPVLLLNGYVNVSDRQQNSLSGDSLNLLSPCVEQVMFIFERIKDNLKNVPIMDTAKQLENFDKMVFAVRLYKKTANYITFYAKTVNGSVDFFPFFDLTQSSSTDVRIPMPEAPLVIKNSNLSLDQIDLIDQFFYKNY